MTVVTTAEEREAITTAVRDFAAHELAPFALEWDATSTFPRETIQRAGVLGLGGICVAEDVGGSALGRVEAAAIFEELAYGDPTIAAYISIHNMVAWMIDVAGSPQQRAQWLPQLVEMRALGCYCLTEPGAGSDAAAITTSAIRDGDEYVVTGVKQFISGAGEAAVAVVMARTGEPGARGISAFLVPTDTAGISYGQLERKMGWHASPTRQVVFDEVRVPATALLGEEHAGFRLAMRALNGGRLNIASCSIGGARLALDRAVRSVNERFTFGAALAERGTVQFALADMATRLRAARLMVQDAAAAVDAHHEDEAMRCAMAKQFATDACFDIANEALQLHGGYGYLHDTGIEKVVRDLRVHQILEGTNEIMRVIVARDVLGGRR